MAHQLRVCGALAETRVKLPVPISSSSELPVTAPGDKIPLVTFMCICTQVSCLTTTQTQSFKEDVKDKSK